MLKLQPCSKLLHTSRVPHCTAECVIIVCVCVCGGGGGVGGAYSQNLNLFEYLIVQIFIPWVKICSIARKYYDNNYESSENG